ncbi:MAG: hypothetical protein ABW061_28780 [Polyangiaceae bacterium]
MAAQTGTSGAASGPAGAANATAGAGAGAAAGAGADGGASSAGKSGAAPMGGAASGGAASGGCTPSDEFDGSTLSSCWQILNGSAASPLIELAVTGGALRLSALGNQGGVWYGGATKSLVYQSISAPAFKLTTSAHSRKASDAAALPTKDLHVERLKRAR